MKRSEQKGFSLRETLRLHKRAIREFSNVLPWLVPALAAQAAVEAVTPYAVIWFSARILNELAGARRPEELWRWVILAVAVGGILAALNTALTSWKNVQIAQNWPAQGVLYTKKWFTMDYVDVDKQSTHDLRVQIEQNAGWQNWGIGRVTMIVPDLVRSVAGIMAAAFMTVHLFTSSASISEKSLNWINHPVAAILLLGLMALLSVCSGKITAWYGKREASYSSKARFGNRSFMYFGAISYDNERAVDIRMWDQPEIIQVYTRNATDQSFGLKGPFARFSTGSGGLALGASAALSAVFTGFVWVYTCLKALGGALGVGSVAQYIGAVIMLSQNLTLLFSTFGTLKSNAEFLRLCFDFLDIPNSMYQGSLTTEKRSDRQYGIEFRDVSFKYPGSDTWVLRHVNVRFQVGGRLAVVGENGSGKTTFIKLLCRLYDPQEGEILLNGIDIKKYNYRDYMDLFSVVFQDFQLLSQPLGDNVAGSTDWDEGRVLAALNDAGFGERLKTLPDGLRTQLYRDYGEEGVEISGGEAQKIAIARALYKNAPFLILDEPTAALDPIAEAEIYAQLDQITGDRTAIYISHRLSSCRFCDEILVFDHGRIVERGAHEALVNDEGGKYHALWHAQARYYEKSK